MSCPIVFRGPNGAASRVAAQHSQDYSNWYASVPGLTVIAPYFAADAKGLLKAAIRSPNPVIFLENELVYGRSFEVPKIDDFVLPIGKARVIKQGSAVTIVTYSIGVGLVLEAAPKLAEEGIDCRDHRSSHHSSPGHGDRAGLGEKDQPPGHGGTRLADLLGGHGSRVPGFQRSL